MIELALGEEKLEAAGKLLLRCALGALMLFHGVHKLFHGIDGIRNLMVEKGLPAFFAPGVYIGEVVAPLLMIVGWGSRPAALVFAFNMLVAIATAHARDVFALGKNGQYPIELPMLFLCGALAVALFGPGPWSLSRGKTRFG